MGLSSLIIGPAEMTLFAGAAIAALVSAIAVRRRRAKKKQRRARARAREFLMEARRGACRPDSPEHARRVPFLVRRIKKLAEESGLNLTDIGASERSLRKLVSLARDQTLTLPHQTGLAMRPSRDARRDPTPSDPAADRPRHAEPKPENAPENPTDFVPGPIAVQMAEFMAPQPRYGNGIELENGPAGPEAEIIIEVDDGHLCSDPAGEPVRPERVGGGADETDDVDIDSLFEKVILPDDDPRVAQAVNAPCYRIIIPSRRN